MCLSLCLCHCLCLCLCLRLCLGLCVCCLCLCLFLCLCVRVYVYVKVYVSVCVCCCVCIFASACISAYILTTVFTKHLSIKQTYIDRHPHTPLYTHTHTHTHTHTVSDTTGDRRKPGEDVRPVRDVFKAKVRALCRDLAVWRQEQSSVQTVIDHVDLRRCFERIHN